MQKVWPTDADVYVIFLISGFTVASETSLCVGTLTLPPAVVSLAFINVYKDNHNNVSIESANWGRYMPGRMADLFCVNLDLEFLWTELDPFNSQVLTSVFSSKNWPQVKQMLDAKKTCWTKDQKTCQGAHQMEPLSPLISLVNPSPSIDLKIESFSFVIRLNRMNAFAACCLT